MIHDCERHPTPREACYRHCSCRCDGCRQDHRHRQIERGQYRLTKRPASEMVEEVAWLIGTDSPDNLAQRLGITLPGLYKALGKGGPEGKALKTRLIAESKEEGARIRDAGLGRWTTPRVVAA